MGSAHATGGTDELVAFLFEAFHGDARPSIASHAAELGNVGWISAGLRREREDVRPLREEECSLGHPGMDSFRTRRGLP